MPSGLPDILADDLSVVFCGLNPGLEAAATGHHFIGRGNRFWRVLYLAGFTPREITPAEDVTLLSFGCGLTAVVERPSGSAEEIRRDEFVAGGLALHRKIENYRPRFVAFLGKAAFAAIAKQRDIHWGPQPAAIGNAGVWVLPNPSGRNRSFSLDDLVGAYSQLKRKADLMSSTHIEA